MDKRRNRTRNEITHRSGSDVELEMLNHLHNSGPSSVTELLYVARLNHSQSKRGIVELEQKHLVVTNTIDEFILINGQTRGRYPTKLAPEIIAKLNRLNGNVKFVVTITPLGEKYLKKMNELQDMLQWLKVN